MGHKEVMRLKLQMGINPTAHIDPNMLLTMWQQLQLENERRQSNQASTMTHPNHLTCTPMRV